MTRNLPTALILLACSAAAQAAGPTWTLTQKIVCPVDKASSMNFVVSPNALHVAYESLGKVFLDGKPQGPFFEDLDKTWDTVTFSPGSSHLAFWAKDPEKKEDKGKYALYYDGKERSDGWSWGENGPLFSGDGKHLAFIGIRNDQRFLVVDNNETSLKPFNVHASAGHFVLSHDGAHLAMATSARPGAHVYFDGKLGPRYKSIRGEKSGLIPTLATSTRFRGLEMPWDGSRVFYVAEKDGPAPNHLIVEQLPDGTVKEHPPRKSISSMMTISPNGKRLAYVARDGADLTLVLDGAETPFTRVQQIAFSRTGAFACIGQRKGDPGDTVSLEGKPLAPAIAGDLIVRDVAFSDDGKHLACTTGAGVLLDGKIVAPKGDYPAYAPSPTGTSVAYVHFVPLHPDRAPRKYIHYAGTATLAVDGTTLTTLDVNRLVSPVVWENDNTFRVMVETREAFLVLEATRK